jgi:hypothetical protein
MMWGKKMKIKWDPTVQDRADDKGAAAVMRISKGNEIAYTDAEKEIHAIIKARAKAVQAGDIDGMASGRYERACEHCGPAPPAAYHYDSASIRSLSTSTKSDVLFCIRVYSYEAINAVT